MLKGFMASLGIVQPQADTFCGYTCELNWSICFFQDRVRHSKYAICRDGSKSWIDCC